MKADLKGTEPNRLTESWMEAVNVGFPAALSFSLTDGGDVL